jgi:hypothetical protein
MITMRTPRKRAATKQRTMTLEEFDRDRAHAIAEAAKPGGVVVVDATGHRQFFMVIPSTPISEFPE